MNLRVMALTVVLGLSVSSAFAQETMNGDQTGAGTSETQIPSDQSGQGVISEYPSGFTADTQETQIPVLETQPGAQEQGTPGADQEMGGEAGPVGPQRGDIPSGDSLGDGMNEGTGAE